MPLNYPDIVQHNNPNLAVVDSDFTRGGVRTPVANLTALYALSSKVDQLKEYSTQVYVTAESAFYTLIDDTNIGNSSGWQKQVNPVNSYTHTQVVASATWTINHNLGYKPNISAFDSGNTPIFGTITHPSLNQSVINFDGSTQGGEAYCT